MRAIGIDLGTTNSAAAVGDTDPRVLPTRDGEQLTPSVVGYVRRRAGGGEIVVGRQAVNNAVRDPENTVFSIKRLMGRQYGEDAVEEVRSRHGIHLADPPAEDAEDQGVRVLLNGEPRSPVDISALILQKVKEDAETALGEAVTHAVITVPAWFEERQRKATEQAGRQAGLDVLRILDEPTAAAVAFGVGREEERHRVLVYDLGGGTFDISIIQMTGGDYVQLESRGDTWLGGDDFDRTIVARMLDWVREEFGEDLSADQAFLVKAKEHAQRAKIALSTQQQVDIFAPLITAVEGVGAIDVDMALSREDFEADIQPLVGRTMELVAEALRSQSLTAEDFTQVLMVGGSTAVPLVQAKVTELFGREKVRRNINPMECVALGAGILATAEPLHIADEAGGEEHADGPRVEQVTPMDLGIEAVEGDHRDVFVAVIPRGTPYPLQRPKTRTFYPTEDRQSLIRIPVYEGLSERASLNEQQGVIEFPLPEGIARTTPVDVSFNYDRNRTLTVGIHVRAKGPDGREPVFEQEVQHNRPRARAGAGTLVDDWREDLQPSLHAAKQYQESYGRYMDAADLQELEGGIREGEQALKAADQARGEEALRVLQNKVMGSGTASMLFIAERVMQDAPSRELAQLLAQATSSLRTAHERRDEAEVKRIAGELRMVVAQIVASRSAVRAVGDREDLGQLLSLRS